MGAWGPSCHPYRPHMVVLRPPGCFWLGVCRVGWLHLRFWVPRNQEAVLGLDVGGPSCEAAQLRGLGGSHSPSFTEAGRGDSPGGWVGIRQWQTPPPVLPEACLLGGQCGGPLVQWALQSTWPGAGLWGRGHPASICTGTVWPWGCGDRGADVLRVSATLLPYL